MPAGTLHLLRDTLFTQKAQSRPQFNGPGSPRGLRAPLHRLTFRQWAVVSSRDRHRPAKCRLIANDSDAAIVWSVEPLVTVGSPRIRLFKTRNQVAASGSCRCPQTERAVHVNPCPKALSNLTYLANRITGARIHISQLSADDRRASEFRNLGGEHAALR